MTIFKKLASAAVLFASAFMATQAQTAKPEAEAIKAVMQKSADDWNRGDLDAFATCYKNSPDILFIGHKISRGYDGMLASYRTGYKDAEHMGKLTFTDVEVQPLDEHFATVTGWFHLKRTAAGGGDANGYYLLVLEKTLQGWKIVRDDTTGVEDKK